MTKEEELKIRKEVKEEDREALADYFQYQGYTWEESVKRAENIIKE